MIYTSRKEVKVGTEHGGIRYKRALWLRRQVGRNERKLDNESSVSVFMAEDEDVFNYFNGFLDDVGGSKCGCLLRLQFYKIQFCVWSWLHLFSSNSSS
jgi:hypothetical protein